MRISDWSSDVCSSDLLREDGLAMRTALVDAVAAQGAHPLTFYPSFVEEDNPASGFVDGVATPRFSHGYFQLRNRFGLLVETHSWKEYPVRVKITRDTDRKSTRLNSSH